ncbi:hypothetical protein X975_24836, partial [Stegodyphus mimosarum]
MLILIKNQANLYFLLIHLQFLFWQKCKLDMLILMSGFYKNILKLIHLKKLCTLNQEIRASVM